MKSFTEPRLHGDIQGQNKCQGIAEKEVLFDVVVDGFSIVDGLIALLTACYVFYVKYPKSTPATGFLLFLQEIILDGLRKRLLMLH